MHLVGERDVSVGVCHWRVEEVPTGQVGQGELGGLGCDCAAVVGQGPGAGERPDDHLRHRVAVGVRIAPVCGGTPSAVRVVLVERGGVACVGRQVVGVGETGGHDGGAAGLGAVFHRVGERDGGDRVGYGVQPQVLDVGVEDDVARGHVAP